MDYYTILGDLKRDSTDSDIKQAYRKHALKWHPDKADKGSAEAVEVATQKFREVAEAFAVLSDPKKRAVFDQYGERGLKQSAPNGRGGTTAGWSFDANPIEMFSDAFGGASPFVDFFGPSSGLSVRLAETGTQTNGKVPPIEANLYCSLEELYSGCSKKQKIVRQRLNSDGKSTSPEDTVITVEVGAGWKAGTKVRFQNHGDEAFNATPGDVVLTLCERPHPRFVRAKNDLVFTARISLCEALAGCTVDVPTLDGRTLALPVNDVVTSSTVMTFEGEGMPVAGGRRAGSAGGRGNLLVKFDVVFPTQLDVKQKNALRKILPP